MTTPALLLKKRPALVAESAAPLEWLVTNGLGGYAFGSVMGPPMRRFHGVLVAAHPAPVGRLLLLHALEERVEVHGKAAVWLRPGRGDRHAVLADFCLLAGLPQWTYDVGGGLTIEQAVMMPHGQNTVHVRYRLVGTAAQARLTIRPWLDFRPHEGRVVPSSQQAYSAFERSASEWEFEQEGGAVRLKMRVWGAPAIFAATPDDWDNIPYQVEHDRGYDHVGSAHAPGAFSIDIAANEDVFVTASTGSWGQLDALLPPAAFELELTRRERLLASSNPALQTAATFLLPLAADQFIVRPATRVADEAQAHAVGTELRTVIAGYPWFTDWGRDTMISLEGLALVTGRHNEARDILRTFALQVRHGLIPNLFPEGEREGLYHTADATLWFFHALHRYDTVSGDASLVQELLPFLEDIVRCHREGTLFNIQVDADGLLTQGAEGMQLTWMDAKVEGWVVTPRRGKPVEINALWHNALKLLESWLVRAGRGLLADDLAREARRCREAFNARFWNPDSSCLYDLVDGEHGDDDACRPNQLMAISVAYPPLEPQHWSAVLQTVVTQLLTPVGLRTLAGGHPDYKSHYAGDLRTRDAAYHQGTVWPWLVGPFVDAWLATHPADAAGVRPLIAPLLEHITAGGCIGSISEIFDAELPHTPRGCVAQAWSVAELSRVCVKLAAATPGEQ